MMLGNFLLLSGLALILAAPYLHRGGATRESVRHAGRTLTTIFHPAVGEASHDFDDMLSRLDRGEREREESRSRTPCTP